MFNYNLEGYCAKVLAHSTSWLDEPVVTLEVRMPRFLLPELEKHRNLSLNTESSRAVSLDKTLSESNKESGFMPIWTEHKKGMTGKRMDYNIRVEDAFNEMKDFVFSTCYYLQGRAAHKQNVNRFLEPFSFVTVVLTAEQSILEEMFKLRSPKSTDSFVSKNPSIEDIDFDFGPQPEFQYTAMLVQRTLSLSKPIYLEEGEYHLPYIESYDPKLSKNEDDIFYYSFGRVATASFGNQNNTELGQDYFVNLA
ncbi:MAG: hypothetical protein ACRDBG_02460, partial [Waterburya sp.]